MLYSPVSRLLSLGELLPTDLDLRSCVPFLVSLPPWQYLKEARNGGKVLGPPVWEGSICSGFFIFFAAATC